MQRLNIERNIQFNQNAMMTMVVLLRESWVVDDFLAAVARCCFSHAARGRKACGAENSELIGVVCLSCHHLSTWLLSGGRCVALYTSAVVHRSLRAISIHHRSAGLPVKTALAKTASRQKAPQENSPMILPTCITPMWLTYILVLKSQWSAYATLS